MRVVRVVLFTSTEVVYGVTGTDVTEYGGGSSTPGAERAGDPEAAGRGPLRDVEDS